jgi:hypothetical protein
MAGKERPSLRIAESHLGGGHITKDLEQTQIALAYPSVTIKDPDFYNARGAVGVLSQDMSSRLFTNIREKYGLCYAIFASHESFKDRASVIAYSAAKPELAQKTLDLLLHELRALKDGVEEEELDRVKVGLRRAYHAAGIDFARASGDHDWYYLGRIRPLESAGEDRWPGHERHPRLCRALAGSRCHAGYIGPGTAEINRMTRISLIVAMDQNGLIGNETGLPWRLPADLRRFRKLTTGHPIVMGRKTFEHIGGPLKDRLNIVLTRASEARPILKDCAVANSLDEALQIADKAATRMQTDKSSSSAVRTFIASAAACGSHLLDACRGIFDGNAWFEG